MAIIRESVNLTAGLAEEVYTVPAGKQSVVSVSVSNAANTNVAIQQSSISTNPSPYSVLTFSNNQIAYINTTTNRMVGLIGSAYRFYDLTGENVTTNNFTFNSSELRYQLPQLSSFDPTAAITVAVNGSAFHYGNGLLQPYTVNLSGYGNAGNGVAFLNNSEGLGFRSTANEYIQYQGGTGSSLALYYVSSGHYTDNYNNGYSVSTNIGKNRYSGTSTEYIYAPMQKTGTAPIVMGWDAGDINSSTSNTLSRTATFDGIPDGYHIQWIQECGGGTLAAASENANGTGVNKLYRSPERFWIRASVTGSNFPTMGMTEITDSTWATTLGATASLVKPWLNASTNTFSFQNTSAVMPLSYNFSSNTFSATPPAVTYPVEISSLEATLGTAYLINKYSSTLNDYVIVAGSDAWKLTPNYVSLDASSSLLTGLQNNSEKGGLTLKTGDKVFCYDTLSGSAVIQVYGYEEDA